MNKPKAYNKAGILNSSVMTDELNTNSAIMIAKLKDCKPMGVATYKTTTEMPEELRKALPDIEELKKLL